MGQFSASEFTNILDKSKDLMGAPSSNLTLTYEGFAAANFSSPHMLMFKGTAAITPPAV